MYNIHIQLDLKLAIPCCGAKLENTAIQQKANKRSETLRYLAYNFGKLRLNSHSSSRE